MMTAGPVEGGLEESMDSHNAVVRCALRLGSAPGGLTCTPGPSMLGTCGIPSPPCGPPSPPGGGVEGLIFHLPPRPLPPRPFPLPPLPPLPLASALHLVSVAMNVLFFVFRD